MQMREMRSTRVMRISIRQAAADVKRLRLIGLTALAV
jgi:hypothetical protein